MSAGLGMPAHVLYRETTITTVGHQSSVFGPPSMEGGLSQFDNYEREFRARIAARFPAAHTRQTALGVEHQHPPPPAYSSVASDAKQHTKPAGVPVTNQQPEPVPGMSFNPGFSAQDTQFPSEQHSPMHTFAHTTEGPNAGFRMSTEHYERKRLYIPIVTELYSLLCCPCISCCGCVLGCVACCGITRMLSDANK